MVAAIHSPLELLPSSCAAWEAATATTTGINFFIQVTVSEPVLCRKLVIVSLFSFCLCIHLYTGRFKKSVTVLNIYHFQIVWPTSFSFSLFGDDFLSFDVVEVPVHRRNGFHTRTKNQNRSILVLSRIVRHRRRRQFCREFELLPRDAPSSNPIMICVQHLESTGTVHTAQHTQEQFSSHHVPR